MFSHAFTLCLHFTAKYMSYFLGNSRHDEPSFLLGKAGHYAVGAVLGHVTGNQQLTDECVHRYVSAADICKPIDFFRHGGDELFVGRAGYLCGALWMQQKLGYQPVPKDSLGTIWKAIVESGKKYAKLHKSPCPLMYSYYDTEYLGESSVICLAYYLDPTLDSRSIADIKLNFLVSYLKICILAEAKCLKLTIFMQLIRRSISYTRLL